MSGDDTIFLLARELEWAEAYLRDFPECVLGQLYFSLLERELTAAEREREQWLREIRRSE